MAKGLCPGVGQSCKKESVEKRGRERERPRFLGVRGKPIKPLPRACTAHEGTGHLPKQVLKAQAGKVGLQVSTLRRAGRGERDGEGTSTSRVSAPKNVG